MLARKALGRRHLVLAAVVFALGTVATACSEPFAHRNPYDEDTPLELELIALQDTAYTPEDILTFQLVTRPAHTFNSVGWSSTRPDLLTALGSGRFRFQVRPPVNVSVNVIATVGRRSASASIVLKGQ